MRQEPSRSVGKRALVHGLVLVGVILNVSIILIWFPRPNLWIDATVWPNINYGDMYGLGNASADAIAGAFRYSPLAAWVLYPTRLVPFAVLIALYLALNVAVLWIMAGRGSVLLSVAFTPVMLELLNGNIHILLGFAIWLGIRRPAAWAFLLLTKVTPGVGLLWFVARREWRNLAIALGATAAVVAIGFAIEPRQWLDWFNSLVVAGNRPTASGVPPLGLRLPVAALIAFYAGRSGRAWLLPIACALAAPILWLQTAAILAACFPLWWERERFLPASPAPLPVLAPVPVP